MSLYIASLNSGSNGNCYYIGNGKDAVLIDAGLSCKETERRMQHCGLSLNQVRAVFISHEHTDHIKGLELLSKKYKLPVYITPKTLNNSSLKLEPGLIQPWTTTSSIQIKGLRIEAFPKLHDAADACSFVVKGNDITIGIFTDIGKVCERLSEQFKRCDAAFLEANYDEEMLQNGPYPYHLKRRISGGRGHLSNKEALELFLQHRPQHMSHLLLSHLSKDNNHPELAANLFREIGTAVQISVASRHEASAVFQVAAKERPADIGLPLHQGKVKQMALF